jgi:hypothetical protein
VWLAVSGVVVVLSLFLLSLGNISIFSANVFLRGAGIDPTLGIFISKRYQALPHERGSVLLEAGRTLTDLEGLRLTLAVDSTRAAIQRIRRPGGTQSFSFAITREAPGIVHISLVGAPKTFTAGSSLLDIELELADNAVLRAGDAIPIRIIGAEYVFDATQVSTVSSDGLVTTTAATNALTPPPPPAILDVVKNVLTRFRDSNIVIRGQNLPPSPLVTIGPRIATVLTSSATEVMVRIPADLPDGTHPLSVESLLSEEEIVLSTVPGAGAPVDLLEDLLFFEFNPVWKKIGKEPEQPVILWIPVFNPLGPLSPLTLTLDLSAIGFPPNVVVTGIGDVAPGKEGVMVNWFRIPVPEELKSQIPIVTQDLAPSLVERKEQRMGLKIDEILPTERDFLIPIKVENQAGTRDEFTTVLRFSSQGIQGNAPVLGSIRVVPNPAKLGDEVKFFTDVTDIDGGVGSITLVTVSLGGIGGDEHILENTLPRSVGGNVSSAVFKSAEPFTITRDVPAGTHDLTVRAMDGQGNTTTATTTLTVTTGYPPAFPGRLEVFPPRALREREATLFVEVQDSDGADDIQFVIADLVDIGAGIVTLKPTMGDLSGAALANLGGLPVVYAAKFNVPPAASIGTHAVTVRAIDSFGIQTDVQVTIDVVGSAAGDAPAFSGRILAQPATASAEEKVEFSVDVSDPQGAGSIQEVSLDLRDIRGGVNVMKPAFETEITGAAPVTYVVKYVLPRTVPSGNYTLTVRAVDDTGNAAITTIPFTVSTKSVRGTAPSVVRAIVSPPVVPPDGVTPFTVQVDVEDPDGIDEDDVEVRVDLSRVGGGLEKFEEESDGFGGDRLGTFTRTVESIPTTVLPGGYDLAIEAWDKSGRRTVTMLRVNVGINLGGDAPRIVSARYVPEVASPGTEQEVRLFVEAEDRNGVSTLTVTADQMQLRGSVEILKPLIAYEKGAFSVRNTFVLEGVKIPEDLPQGVYDIPITLQDQENNVVRGSVRLRVARGAEGHPPAIDIAKVLQDPRAFPNDGETPGSLAVLVRDRDDDTETVLVNFASLARAASAGAEAEAGNVSLFCGASKVVACMKRGTLAGPSARWFVLEDILVPPTTLPTLEPYRITLTAIDSKGNTDEVEVPFQVGVANVEELLAVAPRIVEAVPVTEGEMELLFSVPLASDSIDRTGTQFIIRDTLNAHVQFPVQQVSWDTTRTILYLHHELLRPGHSYTLSIISPSVGGVPLLKTAYGTPFPEGDGSRITFQSFERPKQPAIRSVEVKDLRTILVHFTEPVLPSSVHPDLLPFRATLSSLFTSLPVAVKTGRMWNSLTLELSEDLVEGARYALTLKYVMGPGPVSVPAEGIRITFLAELPVSTRERVIPPNPDLNGDGKVNFDDFVLFSSVYDTEYDPESGESILNTTVPPIGAPKNQQSPPPSSGLEGLLEGRQERPPDAFGGLIPPIMSN